MLKAILIDDEPAATAALAKDLETYCSQDVQIIEICNSPLAGLKAINKHQPDLVFLDIMMTLQKAELEELSPLGFLI